MDSTLDSQLDKRVQTQLVRQTDTKPLLDRRLAVSEHVPASVDDDQSVN